MPHRPNPAIALERVELRPVPSNRLGGFDARPLARREHLRWQPIERLPRGLDPVQVQATSAPLALRHKRQPSPPTFEPSSARRLIEDAYIHAVVAFGIRAPSFA